MSTAVVIGASSGVGRALATALAQRGRHLVLVSRSAQELETLADELRQRFGVHCWPLAQDIGQPDWDVSAFVGECVTRIGEPELLLVPAGGVAGSDNGPNPDAIRPLLETNYIGPARLAAAFGQHMAGRGAGSIVLFSSIAAAAPRAKNPAYSAAKAALETYAKGLRHALDGRGVEVLVLALGYVDTRQTAGMKLLFPKASPEAVAERALNGLEARRIQGGRHYYPRFWWWV
ncbi:MAG TPA: SDR family NAD(P)-dependent oxidoreductase, partial [Polyangiales bacterium]